MFTDSVPDDPGWKALLAQQEPCVSLSEQEVGDTGSLVYRLEKFYEGRFDMVKDDKLCVKWGCRPCNFWSSKKGELRLHLVSKHMEHTRPDRKYLRGSVFTLLIRTVILVELLELPFSFSLT